MLDVSCAKQEKSPLPQIVVTPSTPSSEQPVNSLADEPSMSKSDSAPDEDAFSVTLTTGPAKPKWMPVVPIRALRVVWLLAAIIGILVVHLIIWRRSSDKAVKANDD